MRVMTHQWVFDVLRDVRSFAVENGLEQLERKMAEAIDAAEADLRPVRRDDRPRKLN